MNAAAISVTSAADDGRNVKCPRCWHWHGVVENYDNLCDKCQQSILTDYPDHPSVPHIKAAAEKQRSKYTL